LRSARQPLASRMANASPADHLAILKLNMNRFYRENMGIYSSVRSSTDLDARGASSPATSYAWQDKVRESNEAGTGLKGALEWRDGPLPKVAANTAKPAPAKNRCGSQTWFARV